MIGLHFEDLARHCRVLGEPAFEVVAVGAVGAEGVDVFAVDVLRAKDRAVVEWCNQHHFFLECRYALQRRVQHRAIDKSGGQAARQHPVDHGPGRSGGQVQLDLGVLLVVGRQQRGNPHRRGALQRAQGKGALGFFARHRGAGFLDQVENPPRVIEETPSGRRQAQAAFFTDEQVHAQVLLQLLDPRGQVRGHPMDVLCGHADAAVLGDSLENLELNQVQCILQT
ncbi:hypothetical protein D3C76_821750 [compost metagenome]